MDGHEQIRLLRPGAAHPIAQRHEVIAIAGQHGAHAGFGIHPPVERSCNAQNHVLLPRPVLADGARILAAVAGIDGDDEIARLGPHMLGLDRLLGRRRSTRLQVDDQAISIPMIGCRQEALGMSLPGQIENDAQAPRRTARDAHLFHGARGRADRRVRRLQACVLEVEHQTVRILEEGHRVLRLTRQVDDDPGGIGIGPETNPAHIDGKRRRRGKSEQPSQGQYRAESIHGRI